MSRRPLSPDRIAQYAQNWRALTRARRERAQPVITRIQRQLVAVARLLADEFGATRVVLFGSHARGDATEASDIDLLVYGIPLRELVSATDRARTLLGVHVDLIPADFTESVIREPAEAEGRVLLERTSTGA